MPTHPYKTSDYGGTFRSAFALHRSRIAPVTWMKRPIAGADAFDFTGPYPCVAVADYRALADDVEALRGVGGVSVVFVTNAFDETAVARDLGGLTACKPFKAHNLVQFHKPWRKHLSAHHLRELRLARKGPLVTRISTTTVEYAATFWPLYQVLVARHGITGIQALSRDIVAAQCVLPGVVAVEVLDGNEVIASSLWVHDEREAHIHLHAQTEKAYALGASYLLYEAALDHFSNCVDQVDLGGGAGLSDDPEDGLSRFKRGWSNATARTYLCGEILDPDRYRFLSETHGTTTSAFFPRYRASELLAISSAAPR
ncbi:MAG: hypothetical protein GEU91_00675 [Rhizobiales bacterium]|nr:hypothetical protein [Hyphomicrobiales bacterium]